MEQKALFFLFHWISEAGVKTETKKKYLQRYHPFSKANQRIKSQIYEAIYILPGLNTAHVSMQYTHAHIYTDAHTFTHMHIHTHASTVTHTSICTHTHAHTCIHMNSYVLIYIHMHTSTCTHTSTHIYTQAHTFSCTSQ